MFVLDTNVVSELRKARAGKADPGVAQWAGSIPATLLFVSVVSAHELDYGVRLAEHRDPPQGAILRTWLEGSVLPAFADRLLPVTTDIARLAATFHVPDPAPFRDALIASTALHHGMTIVTRNVRDFQRFDGLEVHDPWT
jgi:hypothetical protein